MASTNSTSSTEPLQSASQSLNVGIVIPACNEQESVAQIVRRCLDANSPEDQIRVVVADNESSDETARRAREAGAEVAPASPRGYGHACLAAIERLGGWPDVLVFLDADGSSRPEEIELLLAPIREGRVDLTLGRRPLDSPMTPPQRWGTRLAAFLIHLRWGRRFQDIGPFRAIRADAFHRLAMRDRTWGWTVEMQILAISQGLRIQEVPTSWEKRLAGVSKISGTVSGVVRAGARILWTIGKYWRR